MKVFDGAKLKQMRLDAQLTQYDLAPLTDITQTRISDIERNVRPPLAKEIDAFMSIFRKAKTDFLSDEKDIVVITGTYTKTKKEADNSETVTFTDAANKVNSAFTNLGDAMKGEQLELFPSDKLPIGRDLAGYVILNTETYAELLESQEKLHKLQNLLK